jgi:hypothetical protein
MTNIPSVAANFAVLTMLAIVLFAVVSAIFGGTNG